MFFGLSFFGGANSIVNTPTDIQHIDYVAIRDAIYDNLFFTQTVDDDPYGPLQADWDGDTIFYAKFNGNTNASNIEYATQTIDKLVVKRREKGTYKWTTIFVKDVNDADDFLINNIDTFNASKKTYEYALIPSLQNIEGTYSIGEVYSEFDGVYVVEKNYYLKMNGVEVMVPDMYGSEISATVDITRNAPSQPVELINHKYPKWVSNTEANYDTIAISGEFVEFVDCNEVTGEGGYFDLDGGWEYRKAFFNFLTDRASKIIKFENGPIWLANIINTPTNSTADPQMPVKRQISFEAVETGDYNSEPDLYYSGLSDIGPEWWG